MSRRLRRRYGRARASLPGIAQWSTFAGGTGAREGQHSYEFRTPTHTYSIGAVGHPRRGYILTVYPSPQHGHGWITPDGKSHSFPHEGSFYRSPQAAVSAAKKFEQFEAHAGRSA